MSEPESRFVVVDGVRLHYLSAGEGPPVLLLHGWPTSSFLWRDTLAPIALTNRVIALDLPGFGRSDKPADASYSFRYYDRALTGFLDALEIDQIGLAVHDLGGPVGLYWALRHQRETFTAEPQFCFFGANEAYLEAKREQLIDELRTNARHLQRVLMHGNQIVGHISANVDPQDAFWGPCAGMSLLLDASVRGRGLLRPIYREHARTRRALVQGGHEPAAGAAPRTDYGSLPPGGDDAA